MRGARPFIFANMREGGGLPEIIGWIEREVLLLDASAA
jgi:hypothetical protein